MSYGGRTTRGTGTSPLGRVVDLRSDTVTLPTAEMRAAIAGAALGDDVYGEDPSVHRLEAMAAELLGKEAAMLVPSGTMGNLAAMLAHAPRGTRVVCGAESHIYNYEAGGAAALGGLIYDPLPNDQGGGLEEGELDRALARSDDEHRAPPGVLCLENTHNRCGGAVLSPAVLADAHSRARAAGVPLHLDGARIFNAAIALGVEVRALSRHADSVLFCLSKGLAAPVGSLLVGPQAFIGRARRARKLLGGSMRQAGVIAAAGIVALTTMTARLANDHRRARMLAAGLAAIPGVRVRTATPESNMVFFDLSALEVCNAAAVARLQEHGVKLGVMGGALRAVTHLDISDADIEHTLQAVTAIAADASAEGVRPS